MAFRRVSIGVLTLGLIALISSASYSAQTFTDIKANLTGVRSCAIAWGDYDADGDLDLVVTGLAEGDTGVVYRSAIFRNDGAGKFLDIGADLPAVREGAVAWGDIDNDGKLDLAIAGWDEHGPVTRIFRNKGNSEFADLGPCPVQMGASSIAWGDYDRDGRQDLAVGESVGTLGPQLFHNNGSNQFTKVDLGLAGMTHTSVAWGAVSYYGFRTLVVSGRMPDGNLRTQFLTYSSTGFTTTTMADGVQDGAIAWINRDNDASPDLLLMGTDASGRPVTRFYKDGQTLTDIGVPGAIRPTLGTFDLDNDGYPDLVVTGNTTDGSSTVRVYRNTSVTEGGSTVRKFVRADFGLPTLQDAAVALGDYDGDYKMDLLVAGDYYDGSKYQAVTRIYRNDGIPADTAPTPPVDDSKVSEYGAGIDQDHYIDVVVQLSDLVKHDAETPNGGLTVNVRIGTTPDGGEVFSGMVLPGGKLQIPYSGNAPGGSLKIGPVDTSSGVTYYCGIQLVDPSLRTSPWVGGPMGALDWAISGRVHYADNSPTPGVEVAKEQLPDGTFLPATLTDAYGKYFVDYPVADITPYKAFHFFDPPSRKITAATMSNQDFLATNGMMPCGAKLPALKSGVVAWGYYTGPELIPDLALAGDTASGPITKVLVNDCHWTLAGEWIENFIDPNLPLVGVKNCALSWIDFDNDGLLDLVAAGETASGGIVTNFYRNTSHSGGGSTWIREFTLVTTGVAGVRYCSMSWGDYNGDGKPDLAIAGEGSGGSITKIYRNDGGGKFTDMRVSLIGVSHCAVAWIDYDNDRDLDLIVVGESSPGTSVARLYRNDGGGRFIDTTCPFVPMKDCCIALGDMNNDGSLDVFMCGDSSGAPTTKVYTNQGGVFSDFRTNLPGVKNGCLALCDFDNDGKLDLEIAGLLSDGVTRISRLYHGEGAAFAEWPDAIPGLEHCSLAWSPLLHGNGPDECRNMCLAVAGTDATSTPSLKIYKTILRKKNTKPNPPSSVTAVPENGGITFRWNAGSDAETSALGLSYSLRVGTSSVASDICTGLMFPALGTVQQSVSWHIDGLDITNHTYYYSVQSVDTGYRTSDWSMQRMIPAPLYTVGTPTLTPAGGTFSGPINVKVTCATDGGVIHYSTTGNNPTLSDPTIQSGSSLLVDSDTTLKVAAWKTGWNTSDVVTGVYQFRAVTEQLTASINYPTSADTYSTSNPTLAMEGSATGGGGVTTVVWTNDRGGSGNCSYTTYWRATGIPLQVGRNLITITARSKDGSVATDTLVVQYTAITTRIPAGLWMFACPVIPANIDPLLSITVTGNYWYAYKPTAKSYLGYPDRYTWFDPPSSTPGRGWWAKISQEQNAPIGAMPAQDQPVTIHLYAGWNMVGQPYMSRIKWDTTAIKVKEGAAAARSIKDAATLIHDYAWGWKPNTGDMYKGAYYLVGDPSVRTGASNILEPWCAYWVKVTRDCDLILPPPQIP